MGILIMKHLIDTKKYIVSEYFKSGLSKLEYCKKVSVSNSTLYRWIKEFENNPIDSTNLNFIPVIEQPSKDNTQSVNNKLDLRLKINQQFELIIPHGTDVTYVSSLLQQVAK